MEMSSLDLHSVQLNINRVSNSIPGAPVLNHAFTISELPSFSYTHLSASPPCPAHSPHRQPAKPDSQGAYRAFCRPGCLIALSKPAPAFCLPPPPQKYLPGLACVVLPLRCFSSICLTTWLFRLCSIIRFRFGAHCMFNPIRWLDLRCFPSHAAEGGEITSRPVACRKPTASLRRCCLQISTNSIHKE